MVLKPFLVHELVLWLWGLLVVLLIAVLGGHCPLTLFAPMLAYAGEVEGYWAGDKTKKHKPKDNLGSQGDLLWCTSIAQLLPHQRPQD